MGKIHTQKCISSVHSVLCCTAELRQARWSPQKGDAEGRAPETNGRKLILKAKWFGGGGVCVCLGARGGDGVSKQAENSIFGTDLLPSIPPTQHSTIHSRDL